MAVSVELDVAPPRSQGPERASELGALAVVATPEAANPVVREHHFSREDQESDEQLVRRGSAGLDGLYRRHHGAVYRYCVGVLRSPEEAADASQSAWVRALVALAAKDTAVLNVRPWLYAIARNECLDRLRAGRGTQTVDLGELELAGGALPEEAHEAREEVGALLDDLGTLSERQRSAIVLREFCGLGAQELAEALDTTGPRALGLVADARRTLLERRWGRRLSCDHVRHELARARRRAAGLRAHLEACAPCQRFERQRRGRALSSLGLAPWGLLRFVGERMATIGASPAAVKGMVAASLAAAVVGVSPQISAPAPSPSPAGGQPAHTAKAGEGRTRTPARGPELVGGRVADPPSPTGTAAPADTARSGPARRARRPAARRPDAGPLPSAPPATAGTMPGPAREAPPAAPGSSQADPGARSGPASPLVIDAGVSTSERDAVITVGPSSGGTLDPAGQAINDTLRAAERAVGRSGRRSG